MEISTKVIAVSRKGNKVMAKEVNRSQIKEIIEKCNKSGWSRPTFYQPGFYQPLK